MTISKTLLCLFLAFGSLCIQAQSQTQCPTFYGDYGQQGASFQLCSSGNVPAQNNDQASSFVVPAGYLITLFADYSYGGQSFGPYGPGSYNVPASFNDQLSSVNISQLATSKCATFFTDANQQGSAFQLCSSGNVPAQYNDQASSFVVPNGYTVTLYADGNFGGQSYGPYAQGTYNTIPAAINDQLSSAKISLALDPNCATFYTDANQQGGVFQLCSSGNAPAQYNDQVSSFVVPAGVLVTLYSDGNFGGQSSGPYAKGSYNVPAAFNDQLSSATISQIQTSKCATFFTDYNQQGNVFQLCSSGNVPSQYNDQASSLIVPTGYTVTLYPNANYGGQAYGPYSAGSYNVPAAFNDQLSSARISQVRSPTCPTFYTDANQKGNSFQLCSSGNVPAQYNDQVSSFYVPSGYYVRLYSNGNYGGANAGVYGAGSYNVPANFNDQLSSVVVTRR